MTIGFRIRRNARTVSPEVVERFRALPVANVSDSMSRISAAGPRIRPMHRSGVLAGPALTVRTRPGDNLMLHKAIDIAAPGDVIVVDGGGDLTNALMGELMLAHAIRRGVAGFVLNGAIRDAAALYERNLPVFAAGVTHRGPYRDGPGEIGFPISIDGMIFEPGDLVLGDCDGIVVVPQDQVENVYVAAKAKHEAENRQMEATEAGTVDRSWVDKSLARLGCEFLD
ncbi:RraA family protein [Microvirga makkahensis]|uniref:Putative 4-hydroxy-4-methyl-2-oxoglutarate aldolase n=1 Tax=Microvirga makkahensis TaxID=1128670 RepID=A0A7X3MTY3_9HYPH|nr:RraA family protein [Microvirga makkahensis]MXQ13096.1 RraA family protein [Microvirga makkahensis]